MKKKVIVIGAGIAGLTAGIYAQRSGFDVTILEQHNIPGGMCTGWRRKGYYFDNAMHWLTGSAHNKSDLNRLWQEVGALNEKIPVRYNDVFRSFNWEGKTIYIYRDIEKTGKHLKEISPEDTEAINRFVADVKKIGKMQMPVMNIKKLKTATKQKDSLGSMLKMLPVMPKMISLSGLTVSEYAARFKHAGIRLLLNRIISDAGTDYNAVALIISLATLAAGDGGYPEGGSVAMAKRMADTFTALGGQIIYNTKATKVIVENGKTTGVVVNGKEMRTDAVIVTQEVIAAAKTLFDEVPKDEWVQNLIHNTKPAVCCFVSIGVRAVLEQTSMVKLKTPITLGSFSYNVLTLNNYLSYKGYSPEGGTALTTIFFGDSYEFWQKARKEGRYEAEKEALGKQVINAICQHYPQCEGKIEVVDVATPLTYERYTGSTHGAWMTVMGKGEGGAVSSPCAIDSASGLYFAGHRVMKPGGMPAALLTGRTAAQMVCKQFNAVFV